MLPEAHREAARWLLELRQVSTQELAGRLLNQGALLHSLSALRIHGTMEPRRARRNLAALLAMLMDQRVRAFQKSERAMTSGVTGGVAVIPFA